MAYADLRAFMQALEARGFLHRVPDPVDPRLEITAVCDAVLRQGGPALLFEQPTGASMPVLGNLFGSVQRVALALGCEDAAGLRALGEGLAFLREPQPPAGLRDGLAQLPLYRKALHLRPRRVRSGPVLEQTLEGAQADLGTLPVMTCWPEDAGPLITWALVVTRGPAGGRQNIGVYRMQVLGARRVIVRWLAHRGGALDYQAWRQVRGDEPFPLAVVIGADPATLLAAVTPVPDGMSEYAFSGLLRGARSEVLRLPGTDLDVPARAEIVIEGHLNANDTALEGPFGDHTGYYNEADIFPVMTVARMHRRAAPVYLGTYTGRPPDEPAMLGAALNELFVPLLRKALPEVVDFYLPPEACSYRLAVVSIRKQYAGHAMRVMFGVWSVLRQFLYTKCVVVVDDDIDVRVWADVVWALATRADPGRDLTVLSRTPIDVLDFASPEAGLGGKLGIDATTKWPGETQRAWGRAIVPDAQVAARARAVVDRLGL